MILFWTRRDTHAEAAGKYASGQDFCRLFESEMDRLYLLALLLTGDSRLAEQSFAHALEICLKSNRVFNGWEERWAVFNVIKSAIQIVRPTQSLGAPSSLDNRVQQKDSEFQAVVRAVRQLPSFERFVYVMSVLEKYSDCECSAFLHSAVSEIQPARERAIRQLGSELASLVPQHWRASATA